MEMQDKTIATIGKCIYCGKTDQSLSDERIVPYGLNGEWILGRASCKGCRQITSGFETDVQRNCLLETRAKLGLRTRRRHNRPKEFSLFVKRDHQEEEIRVPIQEHLTLMMLPLFKLPAYLDERPYERGIDLVVPPTVVQIGGPPIEEIGKKYRPQSISSRVKYQPTAFARLLAKIAYGFAVAEFGLDKIQEVYVLPAMKGESEDIGKWVGCANDIKIGIANSIHVIRISVLDHEILGRIKLFAQFDTPEYLVVVGSLGN